MRRVVCAVLLAACGGSHPAATVDATGTHDGAPADTTSMKDAAADASPDAAVAPSGVQCFTEWQRVGNCAAPTITAAYLTQNCAGTTGIFVVGSGFQSANLFDINNGWMPHGPRALPAQLNRDSWNVLTPTFVCITTSADPGYWTGWAMQVRNPDGQLSNSVTVTNQLSGRPALPTTDSTDPFDPDACLEAGMTQQEALTHFAPGASTATIGTLDIVSHDRACNASTGCLAWNAQTSVSSTPIGLAISNNQVDLTLGGSDCGRLGESDYTLTYNSCGAYSVHVAAHCLMLSRTARTAVANDGSYTQTDTAAVLRF